MQIVNNNLANAEHIHPIPQTTAEPIDTHLEKHPLDFIQEEKIKEISSVETKTPDIIKMLDKKVMPFTAFGSAIMNFISAPTRLFDDDNPLKNLINKVSMFGTKLHLALYGAIGMWTAHENKNPLLLVSFAVEALSSVFDLRKIYLFRGIATGIDGAVGAFKDRYEEKNPGRDFKHKDYQTGLKTNLELFKEIFNEIKKNPMQVARLEGAPTLVASSILMVLGSIFGLTVSDKIGASVRDIFGGFNDFGLTQLKNKTARKSGGFYLLGTFKDLMARFFTEKNAAIFGVTEVEKFTRGRDLMHELALGFDKIGQYYFMRFNQEGNINPANLKLQKELIPDLHKSPETNSQLAA
jgi:hypothetical protein